MKISAITLWQPWASLLSCGAKKYKTRSWATSYRGLIAIHAAKHFPKELQELCWEEPFRSELLKAGIKLSFCNMPFGAIIATAELVNCWRIVYHPGPNVDIAKHIPIGAELDVPKKHPDFGRYIVPAEQELLFGDWTPGRYAWEFTNMTMLPEAIPARGRQGLWLWELPEGVIL